MEANRIVFRAAKEQLVETKNLLKDLSLLKFNLGQQLNENSNRQFFSTDEAFDAKLDADLRTELSNTQVHYNDVLESYSVSSFYMAAAMGVLRVDSGSEMADYLVEAADRVRDRLFQMLEDLNKLPSFGNAATDEDTFFMDIIDLGNIHMQAFEKSMK